MTLVVSAALLLAGAVMALKLPRAMEFAESDAARDTGPVRVPAQQGPEATPSPTAPHIPTQPSPNPDPALGHRA